LSEVSPSFEPGVGSPSSQPCSSAKASHAASIRLQSRLTIGERDISYRHELPSISTGYPLRKIALNVEYISARDAFCTSDGCLDRIGDSLVAFDTINLTTAGSIFLVEAISDKLISNFAGSNYLTRGARKMP
jgi:hypothetical protein